MVILPLLISRRILQQVNEVLECLKDLRKISMTVEILAVSSNVPLYFT